LEDLRAQGLLEGRLAICSVPARDLALPDALMPWAMLLFDHETRGPAFLNGLVFAAAAEPQPAVTLTEVAGTSSALLTLEWLPPERGPWNGVRSGQVKRAALAIEAAFSR
jgi:hypothetical protein